MKKLLAMVLALVMTLSLAVSANAFKDDKSISDDYAEAAAVLNGMGVFKGYEDGSFQPSGNATLAEAAKIVKGIDLNAAASRELVAELLFRAIAEASTVNYTPAFGYVTDKVLKLDESTLGYKNFKLVGKADADSFGRPATKWTYNVGDKSTLVVAKADASYTTKVDECDIAKDLGITSSKKIPMRSTRLARLRLPPSSPLSPTSSRSLLSLTASTRSRWVPTTRSAVLISSWAPMAMATPLPVLLLRSSMN